MAATGFGGDRRKGLVRFGRRATDQPNHEPRERRRPPEQPKLAAQTIVLANLEGHQTASDALRRATATTGYALSHQVRTADDKRRDAFLEAARKTHARAQRAWAKKRRQLGTPDPSDVEDAEVVTHPHPR